MSHSVPSTQAIRDRLVSSLKAREVLHARQAVRELLHENSRTREWAFVRKELAKIPKGEMPLQSLKVALLSSFSTEFVHAPLIAYGFANGLDVDVYQAGFAQFRQEILNAESKLYAFAPDVIILAVEGKDWIPELYSDYLSTLETGSDDAVSALHREIKTLLEVVCNQTDAAVLVHNLSLPVYSELGILDSRVGPGQMSSVLKLNEWLAGACREIHRAYLIDYAALVARTGSLRWYDNRLGHMAQAPISMDVMPQLTAEYMKFFRALTGQTKKCVVVDLDNTLWGGVLGEAGVNGIQLGPTYPGSSFVAFQRALLRLHKRGVLLAIASKNNPGDVEEVFEHSHMILKKEHFAAVEIHWKAKSESVRDISRRLNIGLEQVVFVDDNPIECEEVSASFPMVHTICLSGPPETFVHAILQEGLFDSLTFSAEDRRRSELYRQRDQANSLRTEALSLEDFYRKLRMTATFSPVQTATVARAAQLSQKTNQFNATTRRYTEADLAGRMNDPEWILSTVSVRDCFGDNGIVGLIMARRQGNALEIDSFLLSCRVIGRSIETAMLAHLAKEAVLRGLQELRGRIIPTAKNEPVRDLFAKHGFTKCAEAAPGVSSWVLSLTDHELSEPEWVAVESAR